MSCFVSSLMPDLKGHKYRGNHILLPPISCPSPLSLAPLRRVSKVFPAHVLKIFPTSGRLSSPPSCFHVVIHSLAVQRLFKSREFSAGMVVKNPPDKQEMQVTWVLIPGSGRSSGAGNGNTLQYSCLENPLVRGARWAIVHWVTKNWTQLSTHAHESS